MKIVILVLLTFGFAQAQMETTAAATQAELTNADIRAQLSELNEKIKTLEVSSEKNSAKSKVSFFGDLRLRQQHEKVSGFDERRIQRLQVKLGAKIDFSENLQATVRLMTGSGANSGNVTLGDNKSAANARRGIGVDLAYVNYQPLEYLTFQAGKLPTPFYFVGKNQMLLDRDITPEGFALKMPLEISEEWSFTILGLASWMVENYDSSAGLDETDSFFNGAQGYAKWKRGDTSVIAGLGTFSFTKVKNNEPKKFFGNSSDVTLNNSRGNTLVIDPLSGNNVYLYNYDLSELFLEAKQKVGEWEFSVFQEIIENYNANIANKATALGATAQYKKWSFSYIDQKVERDSVFALFTDSDFAGNFTASKGTILQVGYKATKEAAFMLTQFDNKNDIDSTLEAKYKRMHLDFTLSF